MNSPPDTKVLPRPRRQVLAIAAISLLVFVVLAALTEIVLRLCMEGRSDEEVIVQLIGGRAASKDEIHLVHPPTFLTDKHGIWTANPKLPGINADGYKSPPFDEPANGRRTVLFLGDSFTYGMTADPDSNAFANLVRDAGYRVFNLGIIGTGIGQYLAQAEIYIPRLRPDVVAVVVYPGDDFEVEPPIRPGSNRNYVTNIGLLPALTDEGERVSFEEAVDRYLGYMGNGFEAMLLRKFHSTAIARLGRQLLDRDGGIRGNIAAAREQLQRISVISRENGARFVLFVVPVREGYQTLSNDRAANLRELAVLDPYAPEPYGDERYAPMPDPHFNNEGHRQFAAFILDVLSKGP